MPQLYLASNSPRRREILQNLGYTIHNIAAEIDETPRTREPAHDYVLRLAVAKNRAARQAHPQAQQFPIISADTSVVHRGAILGKPTSPEHAAAMLRGLSGDTHQALQQNNVQFCPLTPAQIAAYIATGEPLDKAGAYGIQGIGGVFVQHLAGSFTGVMGLPVFETIALLQRCGAAVPPFQAASCA